MQQCLKGLQDRKLTFVCLQNASTKANDAAMKGVNEFKADPQFADAVEVVKVDPGDPKEAKFMAQLKAEPQGEDGEHDVPRPAGHDHCAGRRRAPRRPGWKLR